MTDPLETLLVNVEWHAVEIKRDRGGDYLQEAETGNGITLAELVKRYNALLRSPAPAAPCPICGRVDDNHLQDTKHNQSRCVYCGSPMPKGEIRCKVCHPDEKHAPAATVAGWRPDLEAIEARTKLIPKIGYLVVELRGEDFPLDDGSAIQGETVAEAIVDLARADVPALIAEIRRLTPPAQGDEMRVAGENDFLITVFCSECNGPIIFQGEPWKEGPHLVVLTAFCETCSNTMAVHVKLPVAAVAAVRGAGGEGE